MEKPLKHAIISPSGSHPPKQDYSKIEHDKHTPTIMSMSPEYPKYRDKLIIIGVILFVTVLFGGLYLLTRHKEWSASKLVGEYLPRLYIVFYNNRGIQYYKKGQYDKAISAYTKVIESNPRYAITYYNRGNAYANKGRYGQAIKDFNKALELNPNDAGAYNNLAWILATCPDDRYRDGPVALALAKKTVELALNPEFLDTLAAAYAEVGKFKEAIKTQEKVIAQLRKEGETEKLAELMNHLEAYRAHRPWREKPKTPAGL